MKPNGGGKKLPAKLQAAIDADLGGDGSATVANRLLEKLSLNSFNPDGDRVVSDRESGAISCRHITKVVF
jgi:hypothetical protein